MRIRTQLTTSIVHTYNLSFFHSLIPRPGPALSGKDITQKLYRVNEAVRCSMWSQPVRHAPLVRRRSEEPPPVERRPAMASHRRRSLGPLPAGRRADPTPVTAELGLRRCQTERRPLSAGSRSDTQREWGVAREEGRRMGCGLQMCGCFFRKC